jgi:hypothetical protein
MKKLLLFFVLLATLLPALAQINYRQSTLPSGEVITERLSSDGSWQRVNNLPSDAQFGRFGVRKLNLYTRESKAVFNSSQFGSGKYFAPNYFFSLDINLNQDNVTTRLSQGVSMFSRFIQPNQSEYTALPGSRKFYYQTENELHGPYEGAGYYENDLATIEAWLYAHIPSGLGYWVANIETSNEWHQWQYVNGPYNHGYDSWNNAKSRVIRSERTGEFITLEQLWNSGQWDQEAQVRRNNRLAVMMTIAKARNTYVAYGSSMFQGEPRTNSLSTTNIFKEGTADVSHIPGGNGNGSINLNGRDYSGLNKNVYAYENSLLDYYYYFGWDQFAVSDYNDIWINKLPGTQTMPYIWSKMPIYHIVASEAGHWLANKYRMTTIAGQTNRGSVRMMEPNFEDKFYLSNGQSVVSFVPFQELQNINIDGYLLTPKVWLPPYYFYSAYAVHRFLEGATPGSGFHLWNAPGVCKLPTSHPLYNHHLHSITGGLLLARTDMQPLETFYAGSTLITSPEVQFNQSGSWQTYNPAEAFGFQPDGGRIAQKPVYLVRYRALAGGGWQVYILGGAPLNWGESRTDLIRLPGGALGGNQFRIKLTGPSAQIYEFTVAGTDSGQIYDATTYTINTATGYAGRVSSN